MANRWTGSPFSSKLEVLNKNDNICLLGREWAGIIHEDINVPKIWTVRQFEIVESTTFIREEDISFDYEVYMVRHLVLLKDHWLEPAHRDCI